MKKIHKFNYTIPMSATILDAMEKIDSNADGVAFVVNEDESVVGMVTDGDIRAQILKDASTSDSIERALNRNFSWRRDTDSRETILRMLDSKIKVVPILDQHMRLVDVVTPYTFPVGPNKDLIVRSKAPARISFAGGGSDVTHFFASDDGAVLNATISLYCHVSLRPLSTKEITIESLDLNETKNFDSKEDFLSKSDNFDLFRSVIELINPDFGFHMCLHSDFPIGSGLGGSSTVITAILGCFNELRSDKWGDHELAELAFQAERINMGISGGWQDQYATAFGGFNFIEFNNRGNFISPLRLSKKVYLELQENLVLFGVTSGRNSGLVHDDQKLMMKKPAIKALVKQNVQHSYKMKEYLLRDQLDQFGNGLNIAWKLKREFSKEISNKKLDAIYDHAIENGALGGKLLGAGGGGFFLFYVPPFQKNSLLNAMKIKGLEATRFQFDDVGMQSWTNRIIDN